MNKKPIIIGVVVFILLGNLLFAQETQTHSNSSLLMRMSNVFHDDNSHKFIFENVLLREDLDLKELMNPKLFASFNSYSLRRSVPRMSGTYMDSALLTMLNIINENASTLDNPEAYIKEIRYIIQFSDNRRILVATIEAYRNLILENSLEKSSIPSYTPEELFLIDVSGTLIQESKKRNDESSAYLISTSLPHIRKVLDKAPDMVNNEYFISNISLLFSMHNSIVINPMLEDFIVKLILIQAQN